MDDKKRIKELKFMIQIATLAIPKEREARDRYRKAAAAAPGEKARKMFEMLATQEEHHEAQLKGLIRMMEAELEEAGKG